MLDYFLEATEDDLQKVREDITETDRRLKALKALEIALSEKLGVEPQSKPKRAARTVGRKPRRSKPAKDEDDGATDPDKQAILEAVYELISTEGPGTGQDIALKLTAKGLGTHTPQKIGQLLRGSDWFVREEGMWLIAHSGNRAAA